jgi:hypothetical protein
MKKIWKYSFLMKPGTFKLNVPRGAKFLTAQIQYADPVMWAIVEGDEKEVESRTFVLLETGGGVLDHPGVLRFMATLQFFGGEYVLHLFEEEK